MSMKSKVLREIEKKPRRLKDLKAKLGDERKVQRAVEELVRFGRIRQKNGAFFPAESKKADNALPCRLVKLGKGFAFAKPLTDEERDVFIPGRFLSGAMPGDEIMVSLFDRPRVPGSLEGEVLAVTVPHDQFVGTVQQDNGKFYLIPDECPSVRLQIKKSASGGVEDGDKAAVEIMERGIDYMDHRAGVTMRFGSSERARQCVRALLYAAKIDRHFPEKVKEEAHSLSEPSPAEVSNRRDLRDWPIFTIDSAETKDIDDAVSLSRTETGYQLGVHIADVSFYVKPGSELDKEAFRRASSIYYADSVIPMLPKQLSNNLCSLNQGTDRLAFSCIMDLNDKGEVQAYKFEKSVIRSRVKGVYTEINAILDGCEEPELLAKYAVTEGQIPVMKELYDKLLSLRHQRGYIQFESGEAAFELNEEGVCVGIKKRTRGVTECIIEEFMLLANECAANLARTRQLPCVYRVHEKPDSEDVDKLRTMLNSLGISAKFKGETPTQTELAQLLESVKDQPCYAAVNRGMLRSMSKACYEAKPKGHYGLALEDYAHFTSPIRRYPDLAVHRILSDLCAGVPASELKKRYEDFADRASSQATEREIAILQLERSAEDCYKTEYIHGHLGEEFDGCVSGASKMGLYVELDNTVEGLIHNDMLCRGTPQLTDDLGLWDPVSGERWTMGQKVRIRVLSADVAHRRVDFELVK